MKKIISFIRRLSQDDQFTFGTLIGTIILIVCVLAYEVFAQETTIPLEGEISILNEFTSHSLAELSVFECHARRRYWCAGKCKF